MMLRPSRSDTLSHAFANALVFVFPVLLLCVPRGAGVFLGCVGALALWRYRGMGATWKAYRDYLVPLTWSVVAFLAVYLLSKFYFHTPWDVIDNPSRTLLAIITCWVFLHVAPDPRRLWRGISVALIGALAIVCYQRFLLGEMRPSAWVQPIAFANMVAILGLIGFVRAGAGRRTEVEAWANIIGATLILVVNGTRGSMLAMFVTMMPLLFVRYPRLKVAVFAVLASLIVLLAIGSYFVPDSPVSPRVDQLVSDIRQFERGNAGTSIGARLKMWEIATGSIAAHPLMGVGVGQFARILHASPFCANRDVTPCNLEHAHNDIVEAVSTTGVPGLVVVMGLFLVPGVLFWRARRACQQVGHAIGANLAGAGLGMTMATLVCGLSQVTMAHQANMVFYAGTVGLLLALTAAQAQVAIGEQTAAAPMPDIGRSATRLKRS